MEDNIIYLDHNATTPLDPRVLEQMMPYLTNQFANASSNHKFGHEASQAVKKANNQIAEYKRTVLFTSRNGSNWRNGFLFFEGWSWRDQLSG